MAENISSQRQKPIPPDSGKPKPMPWESVAGPILRVPRKRLAKELEKSLIGEDVLGTFSVETIGTVGLKYAEPGQVETSGTVGLKNAVPGQMVLTPTRIVYSRQIRVNETPEIFVIPLDSYVTMGVPGVESGMVTVSWGGSNRSSGDKEMQVLKLGQVDATVVRSHILYPSSGNRSRG
jgi:hypothetical protein